MPGISYFYPPKLLPMKNLKILFLSSLVLTSLSAFPQTETKEQHDARMEWWREARFGMFIHWGLYAIPAGEWGDKTGYGEWIRTSAEIPLEVYDTLPKHFNPVKFDADEWVKMAKNAGLKYIVITSKHHDGFCMFDTKQTDFDIMNTPYGKDVMKDLSAACKKYGLRFCFYYSIMDWHHPDYLPRRNWETTRSTDGADYSRYFAYMKAELKELLTNYGEIGVLWFDGEWENTWNEKYGKEIYEYCRSLQPGIIINNRVGAGRMDMEGGTKEGMFGGDFGTPEQQIPAKGLPGTNWETCMTMNDHWGYNSHDKDFKSTKEIIRMLCDITSKGGNYLLNIGPKADGTFPKESVDRLAAIGKWTSVNGEAFYGTQASPFSDLKWGRCTRKNTTDGVILYFHVFDWPADGVLKIPGLLNDPSKTYLLSDAKRKPLSISRDEDALLITVPKTAPDSICSVVAVEIKGQLDLTEPPVFITEFDIFIDSLKVTLFSDRQNVEIRFTLDGFAPTDTSYLYVGPVIIQGTCVMSARCFRDGKPVSGTVSKKFKRVSAYAPKATQNPVPGISYKYFEGAFDSLPDFKKLTLVKEGIADNFTFAPRKQVENFAFLWAGYIQVPDNAVYEFYTESDDGSGLWIDDLPVVNNDGLHSRESRSGVIALKKGFHKIRVEYFERTGSDELDVYVRSSKLPKQSIPKDWLYYQPIVK
jgi:alpha-L-fucosidase